MHGVNRKGIDNTWTQQVILDYYVMFISPQSSGLSKAKLAKGFSELKDLFNSVNRTKLGVVQDRCLKFGKAVMKEVGPRKPHHVIQLEVRRWNTPFGLIPKITIGDSQFGGFIDHAAVIV